MTHAILGESERKMQKAVEMLGGELKVVRTGRATPSLVENVKVTYYGAPTPLRQLASISTPESNLIIIKPFDPSSLGEIEKAIHKADLGLTPQNDGKVVRIGVPPLSEERRKQMVNLVKDIAEKAKVAVRNVRRDSNKLVDDEEKAGKLSEDDRFRFKDEIQKMTERHEGKVDELVQRKTKEVLEV